LPVIWAAASKELENTSKLLAKMEESSSSELGNIKNENIDLMAEIARLQEENAMLKMKLKKK
jgi:cell division protein FtsB